MAGFSACENERNPTTIYHPIHHDFTIKTPRKNTDFSGTPAKNAHKTPKTTHSRHPQIFMK
jgi:hypothetical protein